jgi:hypothetical protein
MATEFRLLGPVGFPDGQLYANLRGFGEDGRALTPGEVIRDFLGDPGKELLVAPQTILGCALGNISKPIGRSPGARGRSG